MFVTRTRRRIGSLSRYCDRSSTRANRIGVGLAAAPPTESGQSPNDTGTSPSMSAQRTGLGTLFRSRVILMRYSICCFDVVHAITACVCAAGVTELWLGVEDNIDGTRRV